MSSCDSGAIWLASSMKHTHASSTTMPCTVWQLRLPASHWRQSLSTLSLPPEATDAPSGLQSTVYTSSAWPGRSKRSLRVCTSQTCSTGSTLLSKLPSATGHSPGIALTPCMKHSSLSKQQCMQDQPMCNGLGTPPKHQLLPLHDNTSEFNSALSGIGWFAHHPGDLAPATSWPSLAKRSTR